MNFIGWLAVGALACVWGVSVLALALLAAAAHRDDPRVIVEDPWQKMAHGAPTLAEPTSVDEAIDFARWEIEAPRRPSRTQRRRRTAA